MSRLAIRVGLFVALYLFCLALFFGSNLATIVAIRGTAPLTEDVLRFLFIRDALISIPIAIGVAVFLWRRMRR